MSSRHLPEFWIGRKVWDESINESYVIEEVECDPITGQAKIGIGKLLNGKGWVTVELDDLVPEGNC